MQQVQEVLSLGGPWDAERRDTEVPQLRHTLEDEAEALQIQARGHRPGELFCAVVCEPLLACEAGLLETNRFPMLPSLRV